MDNLTHSLMGAAFARALPKRFQKPEIFWACVIASNVPDADILVYLRPGATSLDYLVHHRGLTHTFLLAPIVGALSAGIAKLFYRQTPWKPDLFVFATLSSLIHVGADFLNNYGVHPFSPFLNRWFYGDSVYIIEPLLWFTLLPFAALSSERNWAKAGWWILGAAMLSLVWIFPLFPRAFAVGLSAFFVLSAQLTRSIRDRSRRIAFVAGLFSFVLILFFSGGALARNALRANWAGQAQGETWMDTSSTPLPGNPFCWSLWIASRTDAEFRYRSAKVALLPSFFSVESCDRLEGRAHTADVVPVSLSSSSTVLWKNESRLSEHEFEATQEKYEDFRKFLRFARFPFLKRTASGELIAGDLRYDREEKLGFAEIKLDSTKDAP